MEYNYKHKRNRRGKPGSVCFPTDTGRQIHLSAGQGQIYTGVAYQDDTEYSRVAYSFELNRFEKLWHDFKMAV